MKCTTRHCKGTSFCTTGCHQELTCNVTAGNGRFSISKVSAGVVCFTAANRTSFDEAACNLNDSSTAVTADTTGTAANRSGSKVTAINIYCSIATVSGVATFTATDRACNIHSTAFDRNGCRTTVAGRTLTATDSFGKGYISRTRNNYCCRATNTTFAVTAANRACNHRTAGDIYRRFTTDRSGTVATTDTITKCTVCLYISAGNCNDTFTTCGMEGTSRADCNATDQLISTFDLTMILCVDFTAGYGYV